MSGAGEKVQPLGASAEVLESERALWGKHIGLLAAAGEQILAKPKIALCRPSAAFVAGAYSTGLGLYLGTLVLLWQQKEFRAPCEFCKAATYIVHVGGSVLTGNWRFGAACPSCARWTKGELPHPVSFSRMCMMAAKANEELTMRFTLGREKRSLKKALLFGDVLKTLSHSSHERGTP